MRLTYYGHACFHVHCSGHDLLFDPFITPNPLAASVDVAAIPADYVLLSHGHEDHVADAEAILHRTGGTLVAAYEVVQWFAAKGLDKGHGMNLGGGFDFPFGRLKFVPALHSSVLPDGTYGGNPGGFVVESPEGAFWYAGDTGLTRDFRLLAEQHELDFAVLPIGDNFTMGAADAALAAAYAGVRRVVGVHYDTFEPIRIDRERARKAFADLDVELLLPEIGEPLELGA